MSLRRIGRLDPILRFPEYKVKWQPITLSDILTEKNIKADEKIPLYSLTIENGISIKTERFERSFLVKDEENAYKEVEIGDFAYNPMNLRYGAIAKNKEGFKVKVSKYYDIFSVSEKYNSNFAEYLFKNYPSIKFYNRFATGSLEEKKRVHFSDFRDFIFPFPQKKEQEKIVSFLTIFDGKISNIRQKHELLETYKRGLMQKLFSQEIRFKQDNGSDFPDWEKKELKELASRCTIKNTEDKISRVLTNSATKGVLNQQDYFDKDIANANNLKGYYVVKEGDFVYNPRISVHAPVGPINKNKVGEGLMSPLYSIFRFNDECNDFYEQYFQTTQWHRYMCSVANYGARHDRINISTSDFMSMPLPSPHPEEQQKIVSALLAFDDKLQHHRNKLTQLETFKKGLLQQLFV